MYFSARIKAIMGSHLKGEIGLGLYKYNADIQKWTALSANAKETRPGTYFNVIFWENGGDKGC